MSTFNVGDKVQVIGSTDTGVVIHTRVTYSKTTTAHHTTDDGGGPENVQVQLDGQRRVKIQVNEDWSEENTRLLPPRVAWIRTDELEIL